MDEHLERLCLIANRLGYMVTFTSNLPWIFGSVKYSPTKRIIIGTRNLDYNKPNLCGDGEISEHAQTLILGHEIGHINVLNTKYANITIEEIRDYCRNTDPNFKIWQEIYAWKTVVNDKNLSCKELEYIQEQINEYVFCEFCGNYTVRTQCEFIQSLIDGLGKVKK
jgi:hypothetical protein